MTWIRSSYVDLLTYFLSFYVIVHLSHFHSRYVLPSVIQWFWKGNDNFLLVECSTVRTLITVWIILVCCE